MFGGGVDRLQGDYVPTQCGLESVRNRYKVDVRYSWEGTAKVSGQVSQVGDRTVACYHNAMYHFVCSTASRTERRRFYVCTSDYVTEAFLPQCTAV